jgi:hypothetical protein
MSNLFRAVFLLLIALTGACAGSPALRDGPAAAAILEPPGRMHKIVSSPPDLSWEVSRRQPKSDYWHVPSDENGHSFFLSRTGFYYFEHENFALRYERTADGFTLAELKKRSGSQPLAQCPVFFPVENCVERHALMLATILSCGSSCTYRFAVIDFYSPFQILNLSPSILSLIKKLADDWLPAPGIDVKFQESGVVFDNDKVWMDYIEERFAFIADHVRKAQQPDGFQLRKPIPW